ncbi:unnamed protein product [Urochloa humidicola]
MLRLRHSLLLHLFTDMHNLLDVPNTPNVLTAYPLLLAGVPGLILCLCGSECLGVREDPNLLRESSRVIPFSSFFARAL